MYNDDHLFSDVAHTFERLTLEGHLASTSAISCLLLVYKRDLQLISAQLDG